MKVFGLVVAEITGVPKLSLLVEVDDVLVLVHPADAVEAAAAKVADVGPDLVVRVLDVELLQKEGRSRVEYLVGASSGLGP